MCVQQRYLLGGMRLTDTVYMLATPPKNFPHMRAARQASIGEMLWGMPADLQACCCCSYSESPCLARQLAVLESLAETGPGQAGRLAVLQPLQCSQAHRAAGGKSPSSLCRPQVASIVPPTGLGDSPTQPRCTATLNPKILTHDPGKHPLSPCDPRT